MKILILGGTGAMGRHLVNILNHKSYDVYVTTRNKSFSCEVATYLTGDAKNEDFILPLLKENWDIVVDFMNYTTDEFASRFQKLLSSAHQYIFISSARVYADSDTPITEESPRLLDISTDFDFLESDEYSLAKARQEDLLFCSGTNNWTIVRPYITYSENRLQLGVLEKEDWLYRILKNRPLLSNYEMLGKITSLTYGLDVANAIKALFGQNKALGEAFHITSPKPMLWSEVLKIYSNVLKKHLHIEYLEEQITIQDFKKWHLAHYQIDYDRIYNREFDNTKINQFIDTENFIEPATGLENCLNSFLAKPSFREINWRSEALKDKQTGCYASILEPIGLKNKLKYAYYRNLYL